MAQIGFKMCVKLIPIEDNQLKLVEEKFRQEMRAHYPQVNVTKSSIPIILAGPEEEVNSGAAKLDVLMKEINEMRVKLPADLITFIRASSAISKYETHFKQSLRTPVSLDVGSDLVLLSLSSHALDEALETIKKDLSLEIVRLQGAAAVAPNLDRMTKFLIKSKNEENHGELRVDFSVIPGPSGTKVRLVGYNEHVNRLKEVLHDYQKNQIEIQEVIKLPHPEMVDCFNRILGLVGMRKTTVTFQASRFPNPSVLMSGPRCKVQEAKEALTSVLTSLILDKLILEGPQARWYFQADGKLTKELVENSCQVLISENHISVPQLIPLQPPDLSILHTSSTHQKSILQFIGLCRKDINDAKAKLKNLYQAHCSTKNLTKEDLADLTEEDVKNLKQLIEKQGLYVQKNPASQGGLMVSGLKDGVNQMVQMLHTITLNRREQRIRDEEDLYPQVAWCILDHCGEWKRLPKTTNYKLEMGNVMEGIVDTEGISWSVELQRMQATRHRTGQKAKLKRLKNRSDFTLPLYWDNMADGKNLEVVSLQPFSQEYCNVQDAFKQTVQKNIRKIERLQNIHLRQAYEVQKNHFSEKNKEKGGAGEKFLYHGTSQDNCESIINNGFNRSFAGTHATLFGHGTYFAVKASYSANPTYSSPAADGSQVMIVARVLTGVYTLGHSNMKIPPPCNGQQRHDLYDSVVDSMNNPSMYIVFTDNQAYPDYLITFK
ncbi:protein mono-ADP-ribosyltransferase PARP14-like [Parambassis ranga]|uniref:Poly [ADP-ribose] polymerase n=1 Tax=Parambassis ranga TaxID=210632 RepID=A0A6P7K722_9TELE|nr:protein mono-ADP-ribosyltransferase PARP14-like [Parambassis ranga]